MSLLHSVASTLSDYGDVFAAPSPTEQAPPGSDQLLKIGGWVKWVAGLVCVIGLIVVGATMTIQHRRGTTGEHGAAIASVFTGSILVGIAALLVTGLGA